MTFVSSKAQKRYELPCIGTSLLQLVISASSSAQTDHSPPAEGATRSPSTYSPPPAWVVMNWKSGQALEQAAQGGGVTIPWGVQKTCRRGTSAYGLAGMVVLHWQLDFMILEVFSNLHDSTILWF